MMTSLREHLRPLVWPCLLGLGLRLGWALWVDPIPVSDSVIYREFALNLLAGKGYAFDSGALTAYWPVGTSAIYALLFKAFGPSLDVIVIFNLALGLALIAVTGLVACEMADARLARVAAWLVACWPALIQFTTILASELIFALLIMLSVFFYLRAKKHPGHAIPWALTIVCAVYVRPIAAPLLLLGPLCLAWELKSWRRPLLLLCVGLLAYQGLTYPWTQRNAALWGESGVIATNFGPNLWMGNNPESTGGYMDLPNRQFDNEVQRDHYFKAEALQFIRSHPLRYLILCAKRGNELFNRETIGIAWNGDFLNRRLSAFGLQALKLFSCIYWWMVLALAVAGGARTARRLTPDWAMLGGMLAVVLAPAILIVTQDRYHLPINPVLALLAASFIVRCTNDKQATRRPGA